MKRKVNGNDEGSRSTPKKQRLQSISEDELHDISEARTQPSDKISSREPSLTKSPSNGALDGSPTPKANGKRLFSTPQKASKLRISETPNTIRNADRSARRKSARTLLDQAEEESEDDALKDDNTLARIIRGEEEEEDALEEEGNEEESPVEPRTPSKRGRPPKVSRKRRSPTPPTNLAPHEHYFLQNRPGPVKTSNETLASLSLLTHEEYFAQIRAYTSNDLHASSRAALLSVHARSFPQWRFELAEKYNVCLYGYGSKRDLTHRFASFLHGQSTSSPTIIIINGYTPNLTLRKLLTTIATALIPPKSLKLPTQPPDLVTLIHSMLTSEKPPITLLLNSIDAQPLRRGTTQSNLARLCEHPKIHLLATADSPHFPLLWDSSLKEQFNWLFHDCTTFEPYEAELNVVDEVHELLGRKARRVGGKDGVGFVLKSLPENARSLYRVLLTEVLTALADGLDDLTTGGQQHSDDEDDNEEEDDDGPGVEKGGKRMQEAGMVEYRVLFLKALEEFICSSEMGFRTLLKEFHDHEMVVSRKDAAGTEVLGIPLGREEMEGVLEDLVIG